MTRDAKVHSIPKSKFGQEVVIGPHGVKSDVSPDPQGLGGEDLGPSPHELLSAALGSCTAITVKMYAERKKWPLEDVEVSIEQESAAEGAHFRKTVILRGTLDETQRARLLEIANHCPVHKALTAKISIETTLGLS